MLIALKDPLIGYVTVDQVLNSINCAFGQMFNSLNQDPCTVAQYLGGVCINGSSCIPCLLSQTSLKLVDLRLPGSSTSYKSGLYRSKSTRC